MNDINIHDTLWITYLGEQTKYLSFQKRQSNGLLKGFLNQLLPAHHQIAVFLLNSSERLNEKPTEGTAIFDIYCQTESGSKFIVEMQKAKANYFKDRSLFYSTFTIQEQAKKGGWDFNL